MKRSGPARPALEDGLRMEAALVEAFAPLRARGATIGAARVRAAARWTRPEPTPLRAIALLTRVGELSTAALISAFLVGGSIASLAAAAPGGAREAAIAGDGVMNGRLALQRAIVSRVAEQRTTGDDLVNAATVRRDARRLDRLPERSPANH